VCGKAECGKSPLDMEFLVHGALEYGEPGVSMNSEGTEQRLIATVASLSFDFRDLIKRKKLRLDYVFIDGTRLPRLQQHQRTVQYGTEHGANAYTP
jgi:circadian clock protein KaiC